VYVCAQLLDDWVLTPTIQGKTTDLSIPLILFASIAGGALAGIYGLLIAIPAAACLKIVLDEVVWPKFKAWAAGRERDFLPIGRE
jgi:predicted PurR-regulated permease PerM